jgi:hypothetical protein
VQECRRARLRLLDIRSRHGIFFGKTRRIEVLHYYREIEMEKVGIAPWIAHMGSGAQCGGKSIEALK